MKKLILLVMICVFAGVGIGWIFAQLAVFDMDDNRVMNEPLEEKNENMITEKPLTISFCGDVLLGGKVGEKIKQQGSDYPYKYVRDIFLKDDATIVNFENAVGHTGSSEDKQYVFRAQYNDIKALKENGVDLVSLANNHAMDFGRSNLETGLAFLQELDLPSIGAGFNEAEAFEPAILEVKGKKIAVFGVTHVLPTVDWYARENQSGLAQGYNINPLISRIHTIRQSVDYVFVYFHWGKEREDFPLEKQRKLAYQLIDEGQVDLIVGSHPHCLQGFEFYHDQLIAYSMGNFIFTHGRQSKTAETGVFQLTIQDDDLNYQFIPAVIRDYRPDIVEGEEKERIIDKLNVFSYNVRIDDEGKISQINVDGATN